ncbi:four helix bundle protein [bacterium]|nr:MAG: four helix bundle protein [bacterium]
MANGSLRESQTFIEIIERLHFPVEVAQLRSRSTEVGRLVGALIRSLTQRQ